jgi:hypothetical protein
MAFRFLKNGGWKVCQILDFAERIRSKVDERIFPLKLIQQTFFLPNFSLWFCKPMGC